MASAPATTLTPDAVAYLRRDENVRIEVDSIRPIIALLAGGLLVVSLTCLLAYDFRWGIAKTVVVGVLFSIGSFCLSLGLTKIFSRRSRSLTPGLVATSDQIIFSDEHSISWFPITDLVSIDYKHSFNGRKYEFSTVSIIIPGEARKYRVDGLDESESIVDQIEQAKKQALVRSTKPGASAANDPLSGIETSGKRQLGKLILSAVGAVLIGASLTAVGVVANEYFDDRLSWDKALTTNRASSYREYLRGHSSGRWSTEASERLKNFYDEAERKYKTILGAGHDEAAVESVLAILRYARDTHEFRVAVTFERNADIPPDLVEQLKKEHEVKNVLPVGSTFTEAKMKEREAQLFEYLQSTFAQIFPDDIVELTTDCSERCAKFLVRYETSFEETIYYDVREEDVAREDRSWSPGILIEWRFSLDVPGQSSYSFELNSAPADTINYDRVDDSKPGSESEADQHSFYDAMVASSFDDFRAHTLFNIGIGPDPHPESADDGIDAK